MRSSQLGVMGDEHEQAVGARVLQGTPQSEHQRRVKMDFGLVDNQCFALGDTEDSRSKIED